MFAAHIAVLALIGITPLLLFLDTWLVTGLVALYVAASLGGIAVSIRPGAADHWIKTMRSAAIMAVLPLVWLVIQLLPLPIGGVSRSIWQSAGAALNINLWPHATIDPGLTLLSLGRYSALIAVGFVAGAVAIDRQEAERVFLALGCATALMAIISLLGGERSDLLQDGDVIAIWAGATEAAAFGVIVISGIVIMIIERHTTRPQQNLLLHFYLPLGLAVAGFLICCVGVLLSSSEALIFATSSGLVTVAIIYFVRRIGLGWRAAAAMAVVGVIAAMAITATRGNLAVKDLSVRHASHTSAERISATERIISEVGMSGSGAGTFAAIYRLYATQNLSSHTASAPTFASKLAVELGRPVLWIVVAMTAALIVLMARGGLNRGRDFFYSITGAGVLVAAMILAFCDIGQTSLAVSIVLAATVGLALVQSTSRTI